MGMRTNAAHYMQLPRDILIGRGVLGRLIEVCRRLGFHTAIAVLTGARVYEIVGRTIIKDLHRAKYTVDVSFVEEANMQALAQARTHIQAAEPQVILGVGGGSAIDVAKLAATAEAIPFISIPHRCLPRWHCKSARLH